MAKYQYFNPNPERLKTGDCVVRAIALALGQSWEQTYIELSVQGYLMHDIMSSNAVWDAYLKRKGYFRAAVPNECPDCYTMSDFADDYPKGIYIVGTGTHAVAIIDGIICDAWDSSAEQPIYYYYRGAK